MTEHLGTGEWERWRDDDRAWKANAMGLLLDHTERLTRVETISGRAEKAASEAEMAKRWSLVSNVVGFVINAALIGFGLKTG